MARHAPTVPRFGARVFIVEGRDGPDAERLRLDHLEGHLEHVERHHGRYVVAGPVRPDPSTDICGSVLLVIAEDEADARALCDEDPYFACGLFEEVTVRAFTPAVGRFLGGVTWVDAEAVRAYAVKARPDGGRGSS
jgi:uncharacterized protein YciI